MLLAWLSLVVAPSCEYIGQHADMMGLYPNAQCTECLRHGCDWCPEKKRKALPEYDGVCHSKMKGSDLGECAVEWLKGSDLGSYADDSSAHQMCSAEYNHRNALLKKRPGSKSVRFPVLLLVPRVLPTHPHPPPLRPAPPLAFGPSVRASSHRFQAAFKQLRAHSPTPNPGRSDHGSWRTAVRDDEAVPHTVKAYPASDRSVT